MAYALGLLFLLVGLVISVALHELGHMLPAKRFGVKVPRYFIGFGPTLWSRKVGETEYGIKAILLGGFVSISGMYLPVPRKGVDRPGRGGRPSMVQEAREYASEELGPDEQHRAFHALSAPKKLTVMFGGPFVNLVICFVLLAVILMGAGMKVATSQLAATSPCMPTAATLGIEQEDAGQDAAAEQPTSVTDPACQLTPAARAGLREGDVVLTWGNREVSDWADIQGAIAAGGTEPVVVSYVRDGVTLDATVTPETLQLPVVDEKGAVVRGSDGEMLLEERPFVGVAATLEVQRQPFTSVPGVFWDQFTATFGVVLRLPQYLAAAASSIFSGEERTDGVMSIVGVGMIAGEIASVPAEDYTVGARLADLTSVLASLNMALFAFNMIPLLPLDGGHIAGALWEGIRRFFAKLRGRPDPGPVDTARLLPLTYVVMGALILMAVVLIVADVVNPLSLFG